MYSTLKGQRTKKITRNGNVCLTHTREDINVLIEANNGNAKIIDDLLRAIDDMAFRINELEKELKSKRINM